MGREKQRLWVMGKQQELQAGISIHLPLSQFLIQEFEGCNFTKKWYKY